MIDSTTDFVITGGQTSSGSTWIAVASKLNQATVGLGQVETTPDFLLDCSLPSLAPWEQRIYEFKADAEQWMMAEAETHAEAFQLIADDWVGEPLPSWFEAWLPR